MALLDPVGRVHAALARAAAATQGEQAQQRLKTARRTLVVGDPQASAEQFFSILEHAELLSDSGWLAPDVRLASIGDHFDYGGFEQRGEAARSGLLVLAWLAAHPREQVTLVVGNHDLARVGELIQLDDATFEAAALRAHELYRARPILQADERAFLADYPMFPSVEVAARDLSAFRTEQRDLVMRLLLERRFRLARAERGLLLVHAGATRQDLERAQVPSSERTDAEAIAERLNAIFDEAVEHWDGQRPFEVPGFFAPGSAAQGESTGFLFHRAVQPNDATGERPTGRRFDPRTLPLGLAQVIGHVRDPKCRLLLGSWVRDSAAEEGALRHLKTDGRNVVYARGLPDEPPTTREAVLLFVDGGMHHVPASRYQLLQLPCF